jgi:FdrA protein
VTVRHVTLLPDTYLDSVIQMSGTRTMEDTPGVSWAAAAMATSANLQTLAVRGFTQPELATAKPNDLFIAIEAEDQSAADAAVASAREVLFASRKSLGSLDKPAPRSIDEALDQQPDANIAVISVPGAYAALEAHAALARGLDVLLFSDNVSREDEIALKEHATARKRLVMGPGAGTAHLGGVGLGFANVVGHGRVGVASAAGTGAQEAMALLDRWGVGVSHVIGLGGRDLNADIDGRMAKLAIQALEDDPQTDVILVVSKPPAPSVASDILDREHPTPMAAAFMGVKDTGTRSGAIVSDTLEGGVVATLRMLGRAVPDLQAISGPSLPEVIARLASERTTIQGLYSGGTLCYEALALLSRTYPHPVYSNIPLDPSLRVPAPAGASVLLDLGEEEYTQGRPHPMIDPSLRIEMLERLVDDPTVAVVLLDVVLGHGSHVDPAGVLAPVLTRLNDSSGPQVVAYVLGTAGDPQGYASQVQTLVDAGCMVTETAARAALLAAAIAERDPDVVRLPL